jgi:TolA protein
VNLGLTMSFAVHTVLILWALVTIQRVKPIEIPPPPAIAVSIVSPSDLAELAKGERTAKNLTSQGAEGTAKQEPIKQPKTPPPPRETAAPPPPPPPAEPKADPIKEALLKEPQPPAPLPEVKPPPPPPAPSVDETKKQQDALLAAAAERKRLDDERKRVEDEKKRLDDEKKRVAELERQKRLQEQKKREAELTKKRAAEAAAKAKADADAKAKEFDPNDIMKKIETADSGPKQALVDKAKVKPAAVAGTKGPGPKGPQSGDPTGTAPLTKGEQNQLVALMRDQLARCWNINSGHPDAARMQPVFDFELNRDGSLRGEPVLTNPDQSPAFQDAANAARRALRCASPFKGLPPEKYEHWEYASFRFDPSQMFR